MLVGYWWESQKERDHWKEQDVGRWVISKMDFREIEWDGVDWIYMAQDRDHLRARVTTVLNLRVPLNPGKFLSGCPINGSSRRAQLRK
jgi:hypothetical protein